jgi:hypothetical protein
MTNGLSIIGHVAGVIEQGQIDGSQWKAPKAAGLGK